MHRSGTLGTLFNRTHSVTFGQSLVSGWTDGLTIQQRTRATTKRSVRRNINHLLDDFLQVVTIIILLPVRSFPNLLLLHSLPDYSVLCPGHPTTHSIHPFIQR